MIKLYIIFIAIVFFIGCSSKKKINILDIEPEKVINICFENSGIDSVPATLCIYKRNDIQRMITCMKKSQKVFDPKVNINYGLIECRVLCEKEISFLIIKTKYDGVILRYEDFFVPHYYRNDSLLDIIIHRR